LGAATFEQWSGREDKEKARIHRRQTANCGPLLNCPAALLRFRPAMAFMFENLQVYQKAVDLADRIAARTETFPRGYYFLTDQLNRAVLSISTNLAEGNGRFTKADRKNFFTISRGSVQECVPLLEVCRRRGLIQQPDHDALKSNLEEISRMLSGLIAGMDKRQA
jgi:four helix bundle protein